jgi:hypothetical protein
LEWQKVSSRARIKVFLGTERETACQMLRNDNVLLASVKQILSTAAKELNDG